MKIAFIVYNGVYTPRVMEMLGGLEIDYYTRWEDVRGKGHGTEAHLGTRSFPGTNGVLLIAFQDETVLEKLIRHIMHMNGEISRPDDRIRLFQLPLERVI
jgi:hypothetical protein